MAPERSGGRRGIGTKLESAPNQPLHSLLILDNYDQVTPSMPICKPSYRL
jgi:hypothetical protein